ncbi:hypothetical protein TNCV_50671 [Trichonephila clavipes]|nr:hypothetical protein TNCV_50671 [Trichonephila clavipes]
MEERSGNLAGQGRVDPRLTAAVLTLISAVVDPLLPASSNHRITSTPLPSDSFICPTSFFQSIGTTVFKR